MLCDHCLISIPGKPVTGLDLQGVEKKFCCSACREIYKLIHEQGLAAYYEKRLNQAENFQPLLYELDESLWVDYLKPEKRQSLKLQIQGIHCPSCIWLLSKILEKTTGVIRFSFSLMSSSVQLEWDNEQITLPQLLKIFYQMGYPALPYNRSSYQTSLKATFTNRLIRFGAAAFLAMNQMLFSFALYTGYLHEVGVADSQLLSWLGAALTTPLLFGCGAPLFQQAWKNLKQKYLSTDLLVCLGAGSAYLVSVYGTLTNGEVYYDTAAMIITLVLLGRVIEAHARLKGADTLVRYLSFQAKQAVRLLPDGRKEQIHPDQIKKGDLLLVKAGETIPTDGIIREGNADINESVLTGESAPVYKTINQTVLGGTLAENGFFTFEATMVGQESFLQRLMKITEEAQSNKTSIQQLADRITGWFVPVVSGLATLTFLVRLAQGEPFVSALFGGISVLLIACPCALGLAAPLAISLGIGKAANRGIIIKESKVFEQLAGIKAVVLDKTGTLTKGKPQVVADHLFDQATWAYLINLEACSTHPLGKAISSYKTVAPLPVKDFCSVPGAGVKGTIKGTAVAAGTASFLASLGFDVSTLDYQKEAGNTPVLVAVGEQLAGYLLLEDHIRPEAAAFVSWLQGRAIPVTMLTGDTRKAGQLVADQVGISKLVTECHPEDKLDHIAGLQAAGIAVMMIGDGSNDAPALSLASIGIALGEGTDLALESAAVSLLQPSLTEIPALFALAEKTMRVVKQNLFWAFIYNIIGIPLAVIGLLTPVHAAGMMVISSLSVLLNSLSINRFKVPE